VCVVCVVCVVCGMTMLRDVVACDVACVKLSV
jgi:hypothetical protein